MAEIIHLYEVRQHGLRDYVGRCTCQWESKPVRNYGEALKRARLHFEAKRRSVVHSRVEKE